MRSTQVRSHFPIATALIAYFCGLCLYRSDRTMLWLDEFLAWSLLTDASWRHMLQSWFRGADSGGLLFYAAGRVLVAVAGQAPTAVRMASALCIAVSGYLWFHILRRHFAAVPAALAVLALWLGSTLVQALAIEVRFYGLLLLTFSLAVFTLDWADCRSLGNPVRPATLFTIALVTHALLLSSHMLGLIYSAQIAFAALFASGLGRRRYLYIAGALASWLLLVAYYPAVQQGAAKLNWIGAPNLHDTLRYYYNQPFQLRPANAVLLLLALTAVASLSARALRRRDLGSPLNMLATTLLLSPLLFAVVSHLYKPIFADRYLLPCLTGFAWLLGYALDRIRDRLHGNIVAAAAAVLAGVLILALHAAAIRALPPEPVATLRPIESWPTDLPLVVSNDNAFRRLDFYDRAHRDRYALLMPPGFRANTGTNLFAVVVQQGYGHGMADTNEFLTVHPHFLYARFAVDNGSYLNLLNLHPELCIQRIGSFHYGSETVPMLDITTPGFSNACKPGWNVP